MCIWTSECMLRLYTMYCMSVATFEILYVRCCTSARVHISTYSNVGEAANLEHKRARGTISSPKCR